MFSRNYIISSIFLENIPKIKVHKIIYVKWTLIKRYTLDILYENLGCAHRKPISVADFANFLCCRPSYRVRRVGTSWWAGSCTASTPGRGGDWCGTPGRRVRWRRERRQSIGETRVTSQIRPSTTASGGNCWLQWFVLFILQYCIGKIDWNLMMLMDWFRCYRNCNFYYSVIGFQTLSNMRTTSIQTNWTSCEAANWGVAVSTPRQVYGVAVTGIPINSVNTNSSNNMWKIMW